MSESMIIKLRERPDLESQAARWFHEKWNVPEEAYRLSIRECARQQTSIPQWYLVLDADQCVIAGAGIIENDFHDRTDLRPNLCALFVEKSCRGKGIAKRLLDFAREDCAKMGINTLYLVTDHTGFYEKRGWDFFTMVMDDENNPIRMYAAFTR